MLKIRDFFEDPVSPHCTALAMRGTDSPWSAHPHVQRSAVRNERNEVQWSSSFGSSFNSRGGVFLIGTKMGNLEGSWAPTVEFFYFWHRLRYP